MQRKDIKIGVEYAETAALAYGREPDVRPKRVRFTETRPGPWYRVLTMQYKEGASVVGNRPAWTQVGVMLVKADAPAGAEADLLPSNMRGAIKAKYGEFPGDPRPGDEITYVDRSIKNGLPGEYWHNGGWHATLVVPAEIHRTWADVQAKLDERAAKNAALDAEAKIPEIRAILAATGLDALLRIDRSGSGVTLQVHAVSPIGERWYAELGKWATERGLIEGEVTQ